MMRSGPARTLPAIPPRRWYSETYTVSNRGKAAADLPLGKLDQQRPDGDVDRLEILECDSAVTIADQFCLETVEVRVAPVLVEFKMTGGVKCDGADPAPVAVNPQRDLLRHRAARKQRGIFRAEQFGDPAFKRLNELTLSVTVRPGVRRKCRCRRDQ
jgi:hypothetical protein